MDRDIQNAAPMKVCLLGILTFAVARSDQRLVDAIDLHFGCLQGSAREEIIFDLQLCLDVLDEVQGSENAFWAKAAELALEYPEYRTGFHELAKLRIGT